MSARTALLLAFVLTVIGIAGCGEKPAVTVYKQGQYQGKPDNLPWQSQPFNGNRADWDKAIDGRARKQNEYARIENQ